MAEMQTASGKKSSLRVDLTPMVDLGFILISFFLFTTTLSSPTAMKLVMPDQSCDDCSQAKARATLTLYPGATSVRYEEGTPGVHPMKEAFLDKKPFLRDEILDFKRGLLQEGGQALAVEMTVIIKPSLDASYGQLIGVLDEMTINEVQKYVLVDRAPGAPASAPVPAAASAPVSAAK